MIASLAVKDTKRQGFKIHAADYTHLKQGIYLYQTGDSM